MKTTPSHPSTIYACCSKPACKTYQDLKLFLQIWGFSQEPRKDSVRICFDVEMPAHWGKSRRARFAEALARLPAGH